jgi:colicin import membrane protein
MSALTYPYSEPFKLPAGLLALAVHIVFFAFLYWGVSWRNEPPQGMEVEIWSRLPAPRMAIAPVAPPVAEPAPPQAVEPPAPAAPPKAAPPRPVVPPKADIELAQKKAPKVKPPPRELPIQAKKPEPTQVERKAEEAAKAAAAAEAEQAAAEQATRDAEAALNHARAEREAATTNKVLNDYIGRIKNKIRSNTVMPPDVPDDAQTEFNVTLLPDGSVLDVRLTKPSGSNEYDTAVGRAIIKSHTLPLPPDATLFNRFRELHLTFRPKERE